MEDPVATILEGIAKADGVISSRLVPGQCLLCIEEIARAEQRQIHIKYTNEILKTVSREYSAYNLDKQKVNKAQYGVTRNFRVPDIKSQTL